MFLKSIAIISVIVIMSEAAVIDPPRAQPGEVTYTTEIHKVIPKKSDTKETWEREKHIQSNKNKETNTPELQSGEKVHVDINQGIKSNTITHHKDNELGHEREINSTGTNHMHSEGNRTAYSHSATQDYDSRTDLERDTQKDVKGKEINQTLRNGNLHIDVEDGTKHFYEHVTGDISSSDHPDKDHMKTSNIYYDDNNTSNTVQHDDVVKRTIDLGNYSTVGIIDSNNILNKSDYSTHNAQVNIESDTPEEKKKLNVRSDAVDSQDKTTTIEKTDVIRETPASTLRITDENNNEINNETQRNEKHIEKSHSDKKGTDTFTKEINYKEVKENTVQNTDTLTVNKESKLGKSAPISIVIKATTLDEQHLSKDERNEKEVLTKTPTTKTIEGIIEESQMQYNYSPLPDSEKNGDDENPQSNNNESQKITKESDKEDSNKNNNDNDDEEYDDGTEASNNTGKQKDSQNKDENGKKSENYGTMVFLMPSINKDENAPSDFIDSAMQSDIIQNLLNFMKSNNMTSKIMIAGPINNSDPETLYNKIKNNVKSYQSSLGIAEISINADIIQIFKGKTITQFNGDSNDVDDKPQNDWNEKPKNEDDEK